MRTALVELLIPTLPLWQKAKSFEESGAPLPVRSRVYNRKNQLSSLTPSEQKKTAGLGEAPGTEAALPILFNLCMEGHTGSRILTDYQTAKERL